jgi:hypothetical protein
MCNGRTEQFRTERMELSNGQRAERGRSAPPAAARRYLQGRALWAANQQGGLGGWAGVRVGGPGAIRRVRVPVGGCVGAWRRVHVRVCCAFGWSAQKNRLLEPRDTSNALGTAALTPQGAYLPGETKISRAQAKLIVHKRPPPAPLPRPQHQIFSRVLQILPSPHRPASFARPGWCCPPPGHPP